MSHQIFNRALKIVGFLALFAGLAMPVSNAATDKTEIVKKQRAAKTTVTKKAVTARKSARFTAGTKGRTIIRAAIPGKPSFGQMAGLHGAQDPLELKSSVALVDRKSVV